MGILNKLSAQVVFPRTIPGLQAWFEADQINGLFNPNWPSDGASISSISDLSGNGYNLNQTSSQPTFKTNILNGYPVFRFAAGNFLASAAVPVFRNSGGGTIIVVNKSNNTTGSQTSAIVSTSVAANITRLLVGANGTAYRLGARRLDADSFATLDAGTVDTTNFRIQISRMNWSTGQATIFVNSSQVGNNNTLTSAGLTSNTDAFGISLASSGGAFDGDTAAAFFYNAALSVAQRTALVNYLNLKYRIF